MNASNIPTDVLEHRAAEQRRRLHNSVSELRDRVREKFDVRRNARRYLWPATAVLGVVGLVMGYSTAGIFTRK